MRFTLADRRPNISVGKPIYPRLRARASAHANRAGWPVRGKYLFRLFADVPAQDCIDGKGGTPRRPPEIRASFNIISYLHEIYYNIGARADDATTKNARARVLAIENLAVSIALFNMSATRARARARRFIRNSIKVKGYRTSDQTNRD